MKVRFENYVIEVESINQALDRLEDIVSRINNFIPEIDGQA